MLELKTRADLQRLVDEGLEESLTLDYKASPALSREGKAPDELCKDVSALANSAGGQLIYGIEEDKALAKPSAVDGGVTDPKVTREWIEQILNSKVQPRMDGVRIDRVDMETRQFGYVITIQQSQNGPHQAPDGKYYKRFNLQSVPMHDYEIRDIMRRATTPHLYVKFSFEGSDRTHFDYKANEEISKPVLLIGTLGNQSPQPAHYAMIKVGISAGIQVRSGMPWIGPGTEETEDYGKLHWISQAFSVPPALPIFKELEQPLDQRGIALFFHYGTLGQSHRWPVVVEILCPGFSSREAWFIQQNGSNLRLLPPGHPRLR
jgi:hypothetical protein